MMMRDCIFLVFLGKLKNNSSCLRIEEIVYKSNQAITSTSMMMIILHSRSVVKKEDESNNTKKGEVEKRREREGCYLTFMFYFNGGKVDFTSPTGQEKVAIVSFQKKKKSKSY